MATGTTGTEQVWQLYLDETGSFSATDAGTAGGLLVDETDRGLPVAWLREALKLVQPLSDYPPHATDLRNSAGQLAWWMLRGDPLGISWFSRPLFENARLALVRSASPAAQDFLAAVGSSRFPAWPILKRCEQVLLIEAPIELQGLRAFGMRCDRHLSQLLLRLRGAWGGRFICAVAAQLPSSVGDDDAAARHPDRYLRAVTLLLERIACLLRKSGQRHRVRVRVSARDLERPAIEGITLEVRRDHLAKCAEAATGVAFEREAMASVIFEPLHPESHDESVHPALVLADALMNRLYGWMRMKTWSSLSGTVLSGFGLPAEAPCLSRSRRLPAFATGGPAHDFLSQVFAGEKPEATLLPEGWGKDQALRWAEAATAPAGRHQ